MRVLQCQPRGCCTTMRVLTCQPLGCCANHWGAVISSFDLGRCSPLPFIVFLFRLLLSHKCDAAALVQFLLAIPTTPTRLKNVHKSHNFTCHIQLGPERKKDINSGVSMTSAGAMWPFQVPYPLHNLTSTTAGAMWPFQVP